VKITPALGYRRDDEINCRFGVANGTGLIRGGNETCQKISSVRWGMVFTLSFARCLKLFAEPYLGAKNIL
jgi:hypothetical protein